MSYRALFFALACLSTAALAAPAHAAATVTVTLDVDYGAALPGPVHPVSCAVTVPAGSTVGAVLDAATAKRCIAGWTAQSFPGLGRLVACLDATLGDQCENDAATLFWLFSVNGGAADCGIDGYAVQDGDVIDFAYESWVPSLVPVGATFHCPA